MYGGKKFDSYADHPRVNVPITSGPNAGRTSSAAGRYQFLASTWDAQAKKLGLKDFSPANQDLAAYDLAKTVYGKKTGRDLDADLKSKDPGVISGIGAALAGTWTSLPGGIEQGQGSGRFHSSFNRFLQRQEAASGDGYTPSYTPFSNLNAGSLAAVQSNAALIGSGIQPGGSPLVPPAANNNTNVDMAQKTEITILGGSDPSATASAVAEAQNGVNGRMLRNMQGAVR
nr:glycoside hydrolase family protein [Bosea sp. ASV33]